MNHKTLYLECESGISGDMFAAALLDLGADETVLKRALDSIPVKGFTYEISRVLKSGIDCCDFNVILDEAHENHDHDMEYLYGHDHEEHHHNHEHHHGHDHEHHHEHEHEHHHEHGYEHSHMDAAGVHTHSHEHRHLADILSIIDETDMTKNAKKLAAKIFTIIAEAEAKAHHLPVGEVHFHEVGAVDSIVDVVSAAVLFDNLDISEVIIPSLSEGTGTVRCQHGVLPVPVPATANIAAAYDLPLQIMDVRGEFVTPTGAAIAAAIRTEGELPDTFTVNKIGLGAGKRAYTERPGILRAMLIESKSGETEQIVKIETDIDDATGEMLGHAMKKLMKAGALDVHYTPIYMKKNRPAYELTVICKAEHAKTMETILFQETTTIGIREFPSVMRKVLKRSKKQVETPYGKVDVKWIEGDGFSRGIPEYESVKKLAKKKKVSFVDVYMAAAGKREE